MVRRKFQRSANISTNHNKEGQSKEFFNCADPTCAADHGQIKNLLISDLIQKTQIAMMDPV